MEFLLWRSALMIWLVSVEARVPSPAWLSGWRIWYCCNCGVSRVTVWTQIRSLAQELPYAVGRAEKEKNKSTCLQWILKWTHLIYSEHFFFSFFKILVLLKKSKAIRFSGLSFTAYFSAESIAPISLLGRGRLHPCCGRNSDAICPGLLCLLVSSLTFLVSLEDSR